MVSATSHDATGRRGSGSTARGRLAPSPVRRDGSVRRWARAVAGNRWAEVAVRVGLAARGVVYLLLAYLVARVALGALSSSSMSKPASGPGVAQAVASQSGGTPVLVILAVGLLLYALFSVLDAVLHHDDETPLAKRWGDRALSAWGFVVYGAFSGYCFATASSSSGGSQTSAQADRQHAEWAAAVLRWPGGWIWLGELGTILVIIAAFLVSRAARRSFRPRLDRGAMARPTWEVTMVFGTLGYLGRAGLFALVGWFVLHAAIENDPEQGQGVDGAVRLFAATTSGGYLLWALAVALGVYGLYMFVESRYRHV
ncbi:MAG: DUF1206 domain-containing protein [Jatrophihabitantaceae bacterium]